MADSWGIGRHDTNIIYTCYYHNLRASALAVWHLTLTSTHRTAYAVMVWRSMPHAPDALSKAGTARAQHRPHVLTAPVLCGHKISRGCWSAQAARIIDWSDEGRRGGDRAHAQRGAVSRCSGLCESWLRWDSSVAYRLMVATRAGPTSSMCSGSAPAWEQVPDTPTELPANFLNDRPGRLRAKP